MGKIKEQPINESQRITESETLETQHRGEEIIGGLGLPEFLDALPFYVMLVDEHHNILLANKAVKQALGVEPEQIIGRYCPKLVHGRDEPYPGCPLEEAVKKNCTVVVKELFDPASGRWVASAIYPTRHRTQEGRVIFIHMVHDINQRKQAEEKLKESEEKYRKLIETANDAIFVADAETGIILDVNKKAEELLGIPVEKIIGMHQTQLHPEGESEFYRKIFQDAIQMGRTISGDIFVRREDGHKIPVEVSGSVTELIGKRVKKQSVR